MSKATLHTVPLHAMTSHHTTSLARRLFLLDYPLPLKMHAYLCLTLGLALTFLPHLVVGLPLFNNLSEAAGCARETSSPETVKENPGSGSRGPNHVPTATKRTLSTTGLLSLGLGLSYVGTAAFAKSPQENQLMYAAVPLRLAMSATAALSWWMDPEKRNLFKLTVVVEDFLGSLALIWIMRDWPGWGGWR